MKRSLLIIGHSSSRSLSHKLAQAYATSLEKNGGHAEIIDVYRMKPELPLVEYDDYADWDRDKSVRSHYQDMIRSADEIVFFHPIWWGGLPPRLKNFIDQVFTPGFAYKYGPRKGVPQALNILPRGLLRDTRAKVFITYDAYSLVYAALLFPFITIWSLFILNFCGIRPWRTRYYLHQRVKFSGDTKRQKWLNRAARIGGRAA